MPPELKDASGCTFYGKAKTCGHVWFYEERQDDGTIKRYPLLPARPKPTGTGE